MATKNIVPRADQEGGLGTAAKSWGRLFIENPATGASTAAATISNLDVDQVALDINANNTTANVIDIDSTALTTGNVIDINCDKLTSGSVINIDVDDDVATTMIRPGIIELNWNKSADTGNTYTSDTMGIVVDMCDDATSNHGGSIIAMTGVSIDLDSANANGTVNQVGLEIELTGGEASNRTKGITTSVTDGGTDLHMAGANAKIAGAGNINLDAVGDVTVTNSITSKNYRTIYVDAGSMVPTVTNGAAAGTEELASNDVMVDYFAFDNSVDEKAQFKMVMPEQWDLGAIRARFYWKSSNTDTGDVAWFIQSVAHADSGALDTAFGTAVSVHTADDVGLGTDNDLHITAGTTNMTVAGSPAEGEMVMFQIYRDVSADNYTADAHLVGVLLQYRESMTASAIWATS